jgi:hypothetical protein
MDIYVVFNNAITPGLTTPHGHCMSQGAFSGIFPGTTSCGLQWAFQAHLQPGEQMQHPMQWQQMMMTRYAHPSYYTSAMLNTLMLPNTAPQFFNNEGNGWRPLPSFQSQWMPQAQPGEYHFTPPPHVLRATRGQPEDYSLDKTAENFREAKFPRALNYEQQRIWDDIALKPTSGTSNCVESEAVERMRAVSTSPATIATSGSLGETTGVSVSPPASSSGSMRTDATGSITSVPNDATTPFDDDDGGAKKLEAAATDPNEKGRVPANHRCELCAVFGPLSDTLPHCMCNQKRFHKKCLEKAGSWFPEPGNE